jgi:hypothetical protein
MRQFLPIVLSLSLVRFQCAQIESATGVVAPGTGVEIELLENVSSESLHAGQNVPFKLVRPLEVNGVVLLTAGTPFSGKVTKVDAAGHWGKVGVFDLTLEPLKLADGTLVHAGFRRPPRLNARSEKVGENTLTGIAMAYYFPLIPVALIAASRKGKPFKIRTGERYLVYVTGTEAAPTATESPKP